MPTDDLSDGVLLVTILGAILFIGVAVLSTTAGITIDQTHSSTQIQTSQALDGSESWYQLDSSTGVDETLYNSRGYAINLTGDPDSYMQSSQSFNISTDNTWTVTTWASVDSASATENLSLMSFNARLILTYNGSTSEWRAWYYDDGSLSSWELSVPAPNQPNTLSLLTVTHNGTHLTLYRNNTVSDTVNVTQENVVDVPIDSTNFDGRIEETRTFDEVLNSSQRTSLVTQPLAPRPEWNRTSRIMYDEPYRNTQRILFTDAVLEAQNVRYSQGFSGYQLDGENYTWNDVGPRVQVDSETELPVVYIDYTRKETGIGSLVPEISAALVLAGLLPILVILAVIINTMRSTR